MHGLINATFCTHIFHPSLRYIPKLNPLKKIGSSFEFFFFLTLSNSTNLQPLLKGWMQCAYWKYKYETFLDINVTFTKVENAWNIIPCESACNCFCMGFGFANQYIGNFLGWILFGQTFALNIELFYFTFLSWIYYMMIVCVLNNKSIVEDWVSILSNEQKAWNLV